MTHIICLNPSQQKGIITGYASFFDIRDHHCDRVAKGAFTKTLRAWRILKKMPKMLWQHDPKCPLGVWTHLQENDQGLYVEGRLILGVKQADEAYLLLKEGVIDGLSIGFRTLKATRDKASNSRIL